MIIKENLFKEYVNFVDSIKKQKTYFEINIALFVITVSLFPFHLPFKYLNEKKLFCYNENPKQVILNPI